METLEKAARQVFLSLGDVAAILPKLIAAAVVVLIFVVIARLEQRALASAAQRSRLDPTLQNLIQQIASAGIITFGVGVGLIVLGLTPAAIVASFGVVGLAVGFALKDMLENFIAGIMILWRRPFKVGDMIRVGLNEGAVQVVTFRTTTLLAPDGVEILVPNAQLFTQAVFNYTRTGRRRTSIVLKAPLEIDIEKARDLLQNATCRIRGVVISPPPEVLLLGATSDSYELHLRYWTTPDLATVQTVESAVRQAALSELASPALRATSEEAATND